MQMVMPEAAGLQSSIHDQSVEDMQLLHHYTALTSSTLSEDSGEQALWQLKVPLHAFKHRFLLHGSLAVAALHYSYELPASEKCHWTDVARKHHAQALSQYSLSMENITQENCHALFAFSKLVGAVSYGLAQSLDHQSCPNEFIDAIAEAFELLNDAAVIAYRAHDWLAAGDLSTLKGWYRTPLFEARPERWAWGPKDALKSLLIHVQTAVLTEPAQDGSSEDPKVSENNQAYISSIESLFPIMPTIENPLPKTNTVLGWPIMAKPVFARLLKERDPTALIVLSHYGTVLHCQTDTWWLHGLGSMLHTSITAVIDKEWRPYLNMSSWQVAKTSTVARQPVYHGPRQGIRSWTST